MMDMSKRKRRRALGRLQALEGRIRQEQARAGLKVVASNENPVAVPPPAEIANDNVVTLTLVSNGRSDVFNTLIAGGWYAPDGSMVETSHMGLRDENYYKTC